ncbi:hypothetical protein COR50_04315 [Chitinophaga caeni]|uniref:Uncharacterized protein n=2 Tax=Chitinophaga caeni TaxID=2029983 RepID=A0A291QR75_9BACT|nr:hypothetical protein COR50_04315 [Chitinophaga caeni]
MLKMFPDYIKLVIQDYNRKRAANKLSLNLTNPSPAKLKEECLIIYRERYRPRDEKTLRSFFGTGEGQAESILAIKRCDTDKFRPLVNYLRELTSTTDEKNIELLAWLIDFEQRPYKYGAKYEVLKGVNTNIENGSQNGDEGREPIEEEEVIPIDKTAGEELLISPKEPRKWIGFYQIILNGLLKNSRTIAFVSIAVILAISGTMYWNNRNRPGINSIMGLYGAKGSCMYWNVDHYQQVPCTQKMDKHTLVLALDTFKLVHFKQITQIDTIGLDDVGRVWYSKIKGKLEYFTADGYHPVEIKIRLRPITEYIIRKYIHPDWP